MISVGRLEMLVSFHFPGKNIFQLGRLCQQELSRLSSLVEGGKRGKEVKYLTVQVVDPAL